MLTYRHGERPQRSSILYLALVCSALLGSCGCLVRRGPKILPHDRFDYAGAIARSWQEQMLLNMVKMRYMETPVFLDVQQVVAQYTIEGSATANTPSWGGEINLGAAADFSGRWAESPTITFNPMSGEQFTRSLLQPISPTNLWTLIEADWPISDVFTVAVKSINGLRAQTKGKIGTHSGEPEFYRVLAMLQELQSMDLIGLRVETGANAGGTLYFRAGKADKAAAETVRQVQELLGLNPNAEEYHLTFGAVPENDTDIAMLTRSMLEILEETAAGVEIPAADIRKGRATDLGLGATSSEQVSGFRVRVKSSSGKPSSAEAFETIRYRDSWFWIDDGDLVSKRDFGFLMILFQLVESGTSVAPPVLTISKP
jgi:hypothetical protein